MQLSSISLALTRTGRVADPDAAIKALFAAGEQGAWYDPSDLTTMFQDANGITPVTAVEQPVGLILDKSKGLVFPNGAPSGFGAVPFGVTVNNDGTTDFDPTDYRLVEGASGVTTYYVDKATGADTNPGTSSQPFKTIYKAIMVGRSTAPTMLVKVKGGTYYLTENMNNKVPEATSLSVVSWDGNPVICSNENPNITPASWTLDSDNTYYASVAGYGYSEYRSSVWDAKVGDGFGDYLPLIPAASIAACKATANTYYTDTASLRVYVHCSDNRAPDADIHVFEAWGSPGQYKDYAGSPASGACYFENIHFIGGAVVFSLEQTHATNTTEAVFNGCTFKYSGIAYPQAVETSGNVDVAFYDCSVAESHADGFSYHAYGANPAPRAIEINCEARRCGTILTGTANQGSTMHDGGKIVRVNGNYHHNENDQVADVGAGTKVWMVNCSAADGLKANYAGYLSGNGSGVTTTWLYDCTVSNCTKDLYIGTGSTLNDLNYSTRTAITNLGIITNYAATGLLGNHASQSTTTNRPILRQDAGGKYYLSFDGADDSLATAAIDFTATDKMSVFSGSYFPNDSSYKTIAELGLDSLGGFYVLGRNGLPGYEFAIKGSLGQTVGSCTNVAAPVTAVVTTVLDFAETTNANEIKVRINGTAKTTTQFGAPTAGVGPFGNLGLYIGSRSNGTLRLIGRIYSLIVRGALSTSDEITATEAWVADKTGVTL